MRFGKRIAALAATAVSLCAVAAAPASASTEIANPGPFTLHVTSGAVSLGGAPASSFADQPFDLAGVAAPDGSFTTAGSDIPAVTLPNNSFSSGPLSATIKNQSLTLHLAPSAGTLDPASGSATFTLPVYGTLTAKADFSVTIGSVTTSGTITPTCDIGSLGSPQNLPMSTGPGVSYNAADGSLTMASAPLTTSALDCSAPESYSGDIVNPILSAIDAELRGATGAGSASMTGTFDPAFTAPVVTPPSGNGGGSGGQTAGSGGGAGTTPPPAVVHCVVPKLGHSSLRTIRKKLAANHCKLGKVTRRHSRKVGKNHLLAQRLKPGATLPDGTAVPITLSSGKPKPKPKHHH